jgi:RNA polymerase sigma factor (sigma-70 family)
MGDHGDDRLLSHPLDSEAFSRLYAAQAPRLIAFFARRTYDAQLAVDLTAETFAQAYSGRKRFRGKSDVEAAAWLFGIARRQLARYWRRGHAEQRAVRRLGMQVPHLDDEEASRIIELSGMADLRAVLADELARLPEPTRAAIQLRVVEEREYHEVAELLGTTEIAARARVSRGLTALASALDRAGFAEGAA